jgi:hypothetical protein
VPPRTVDCTTQDYAGRQGKAIDYARLQQELAADPLTTANASGWNTGSGYLKPYAQLSDDLAAQKLNALDTGRIQRRSDILSSEVLEVIDSRDFISNANALVASYFESVTQNASIRLLNADGSDTRLLGNLILAVNNTQGSQTRLRALATRIVSRQQELGLGTVLPSDVSKARSGIW